MKAIVLLSGGLDSAVAAAWTKKKFKDCFALTFKYGQRHKKELECAKELAKFYGMEQKTIGITIPAYSALTTGFPSKPPLDKMNKGLPASFVPGRNMIFLAVAGSLAYDLNAKSIIGGWNVVDNPGYPDCRLDFLSAMETTINYALDTSSEEANYIFIDRPLLFLNKRQIVQMGARYNVPFHLTWSCYEGGDKPCGECSSCKFREKGFKEAGVKDPLICGE